MRPPRTLTALRYVQPLREGGSLPAVVDTDGGLFVVKFRGAGQGPRALVAEVIVTLLARRLGLPTPDLAFVDVHPAFGRSEADPEIQDLLRASHGTNVGLRYLDGAFNFALSAAGDLIDPEFATRLVWLDAFVTNPDRTHRNPNLMVWERRPWLIDHGAALYAHHDWDRVDSARIRTHFPFIRDHVLLGSASGLQDLDTALAERLSPDVLQSIIASVPDELLIDQRGDETREADREAEVARARDRYLAYMTERLEAPRAFVAEAVRARDALASDPKRRLEVRR